MLESRAFLVEPASWVSSEFSVDSFLVSAVRSAALTGSTVDAGIPIKITRANVKIINPALSITYRIVYCEIMLSSRFKIHICSLTFVNAIYLRVYKTVLFTSYEVFLLTKVQFDKKHYRNHTRKYRYRYHNAVRMLARPKGRTTTTNSFGIEL